MESNWRWNVYTSGMWAFGWTLVARILSGPYEGYYLVNDLGEFGTKAVLALDIYGDPESYFYVDIVDDGLPFPGVWDVEPDGT